MMVGFEGRNICESVEWSCFYCIVDFGWSGSGCTVSNAIVRVDYE